MNMRISRLALSLHLAVTLAIAGILPAQPFDEVSDSCLQDKSEARQDKGEAHEGLGRRLQALDRQIFLRLMQAARNHGRTADSDLAGAARDFSDRLDAFAVEVGRLEDNQAVALMRKIGQLRDVVGNLDRAAAVGDLATALPQLFGQSSSPIRLPADLTGGPVNDDCANAIDVSPGDTLLGDTTGATRDGQASCGSSLFSNDVWFKLTVAASGYVFADTLGSGYDTVLSVHSGCPGDLVNQIRCNDDAFGLQSALSFYAYAGSEYWIRLSGFDQAAGEYELHVGLGGEVSGTVTSAENGAPLADGNVRVWTPQGYYIGSDTTDAAGGYAIGGLEAGTYTVSTRYFDGFFDELYDDIPCPGGSCDETTGTPVGVDSTTGATGVDFALEEGGSVTGVVTATATGLPIPDVHVEIWNVDGIQVGNDLTDAAGNYLVRGLSTGTYFAVAESSVYLGEVYDDQPCLGGAPYDCDPTEGTPLVVREAQITAGIDFALDRLGSIAGSITENGSGDPISDVRVEISLLDGTFVRSAYSQSDGTYLVGGLPAGEYLVVADSYDHSDELYDGVACPEGLPNGCDPMDGTSIAVGLNAAVSGIDFVLQRLGAIAGTVTETTTDAPLPGLRIELYQLDGSYVGSDYTDADGHYLMEYLDSGSYAVATDSYYGEYVDELYDDIPCPGGYNYGCDGEDPTPVAVMLETTTGGIDFALDRFGDITGTVTDAETGAPISGLEVYLVSEDGGSYHYHYTDASGQYRFGGLDSGDYFVKTYDYYSGVYVDEVYDDIPCQLGCDPAEVGTPIAVSLNATTSDIDFELQPLGRFTGTVTDAATGEPISGIQVAAIDENGYTIDYGYTDSSGQYALAGLMDGTYFATARDYYSEVYLAELWEDLPCGDGCDPVADGTPIAVSVGETASGIDFTLQIGGVITGTVTHTVTGEPISSVEVRIWSQGGSYVKYDYTSSSGQFSVTGLPTGNYFASTDAYYYSEYLDEVYDDLPCVPGCDPTAGTPIAVVAGATTAGIDFALDRLGVISGTVTSAATGLPLYDAYVSIYDAAGAYVTGEYIYSGAFQVGGLLPGTYFAVANAYEYASEIYDDILCPYGCDPTVGTPITVALNQTVAGIDFALQDRGAISATVVDVASGEPIASIRVELWNSGGSYYTSQYTGVTGVAFFDNLQPGVYYASTGYSSGYLDELYDDIPCLWGASSGCDPTKGTAIVVVPATTREIDFALLYFDTGITGTVTDAAGAAIVGASVDAWDEAGNLVDSTQTLFTGEYFLRLDPGTYHVSTDNGQGYTDEVYPGHPCTDGPPPTFCDPQQGAGVTVTASGPQMIATGIDFALEVSGSWIFSDGFESGDLSAW
jgi:Carboxypeptidase regulatory-like domain